MTPLSTNVYYWGSGLETAFLKIQLTCQVNLGTKEDCFPRIPVPLFTFRWLLDQLLNNGSNLMQIRWQPESPQFRHDECLSESTNVLRDWVEKEQIKKQAYSNLEVDV